MGFLTPAERDALTSALARRWHLWEMHRVKTLTAAARTFNPGCSHLLYEALAREFDEADQVARSREALLAAVDALEAHLQGDYAALFRDAGTQAEFESMVAEIRRAVGGAREGGPR
jgi:malate synthase